MAARYPDSSSSDDEIDDGAEGMTSGVKSIVIDGEKKGKAKQSTESEENGLTPDVEDLGEPGMSCEIKNLYSGKEDKRGRFQWQVRVIGAAT